jgi:hypothetical protein
VETTATLAEKLGDHTEVFLLSSCSYSNAFKAEALRHNCEEEAKNDTIYVKAMNLLKAYGAALNKIVEEQSFEADDQLGLVLEGGDDLGWFDLTDDQIEGSKTIVDALFDLIVSAKKRQTLSREIEKNNAAVQRIVEKLMLSMEARSLDYSFIQNRAKEEFGLVLGYSSVDRVLYNYYTAAPAYDSLRIKHNALDEITAELLIRTANAEARKLLEAKKSMEAFGKAHQLLYDNLAKIGRGADEDVVKEIFGQLQLIYEGVQKLEAEKENTQRSTD